MKIRLLIVRREHALRRVTPHIIGVKIFRVAGVEITGEFIETLFPGCALGVSSPRFHSPIKPV